MDEAIGSWTSIDECYNLPSLAVKERRQNGCPIRSAPPLWDHAHCTPAPFVNPSHLPWEPLTCFPYGQMFGITGVGLGTIRRLQNGGKRPRHGLDVWDRVRFLLSPTCSEYSFLTACIAKYEQPSSGKRSFYLFPVAMVYIHYWHTSRKWTNN